MARYIHVGFPKNSAEREGIKLLRDVLPAHYVVIGNFELQLPQRKNTLEFDAVVIGEHGVFAVEIKGWRGLIRGDIRRWELEWGKVENPFIYTEVKAKALRDHLVKHIPDLPRETYCSAVVLLPWDDVELMIDDPRSLRIAQSNSLWDVFVNKDDILEFGPGYFLSSEHRQHAIDAIVPVAVVPGERQVEVPHYQIVQEVDTINKPYREFVGRHDFVTSRQRVRIKAYSADALADSQSQSKEISRVLRDFDALNELEENPYIARGYEVIPVQDDELTIYVVSEWVGHTTLADYLHYLRHNATSIDANIEAMCMIYAKQFLSGVAFMHEKRIIHRNLHPGVVYLNANKNNETSLKIADFDYARVDYTQSILNMDALTLDGRNAYAAPEVWAGAPHDHRADLFSVGIILYELLTRRRFYNDISEIFRHDEIWSKNSARLSSPTWHKTLDSLLKSDPSKRAPNLKHVLEVF